MASDGGFDVIESFCVPKLMFQRVCVKQLVKGNGIPLHLTHANSTMKDMDAI